ncbi:response regulator [Rubrolithibacter danxiaensis]|uniref:response regulator n=1 Tax=Rubrolithibacter danxiaensis TaxID=3390805 RepID=UPI003BF88A0B
MDKRILVVDDENDILEILELILSEEGYKVATSPTAEGILDKIEAIKPDLILMDVDIGEEDGRKICSVIKANAKTHDIPVIMISAYSSIADTVQEAGAEDFIPKPFSIYTLIDHIERQLAA